MCYRSDWSDAAVRRFVKRVGQKRVDDLLRLARADALGKGRPVEGELELLLELSARVDDVLTQGAALTTQDLAVTGHDIMDALNVEPGPVVGRILGALLERVLEDPALNERGELLRLAEEVGRDLQWEAE